LNYFNENSDNADIEVFDKMIENTDFNIAESKIKNKVLSKLKEMEANWNHIIDHQKTDL